VLRPFLHLRTKGAAVFGLVLMIVVRVVPALQISIDFTERLSFESAAVSISSQNFDPGRVKRDRRP
jgi:hypothetical protein